MARRQPAAASFCAIAHAMLRLFARPKITAVFCDSLIRSVSKWPGYSPASTGCRLEAGATKSNSMKRFLDFLYRITKDHGPPVRAAHRTIRFRKRAKQPFHFRLIERHVHLDGRVARG